MEGFELSVVINRPIEEVFAYLADLENDVHWRSEWIEGNMITEGPVGVGSKFRLVGSALGRRVATVYELIQYEPDRIASWKALSGPLPLTFSRTFAGTEAGTQVTIRYQADLRGFLKLLKPLLVSSGRRQLEGDLPKLTELMNVAQPAKSCVTDE